MIMESNHGGTRVTGDTSPGGVRTLGEIVEVTEGTDDKGGKDRAKVMLYGKNWWIDARDVTKVDNLSVRVLWRAFRKNRKLATFRRKCLGLGLGPYSEEGNKL